MTIITYGGGEILAKIFESISLLFYGQEGSLIRALMILTASIGAFWVLTEVLISHAGTKLITKFFLPLLLIFHFLLLPQTEVRIEDVTVMQSADASKRSSYTIDRVPFLLGKLATIVSSFGYKMTQAIETIMHVPEDISYNRTGHIFGAENLLEASQYKMQNGDLENNFRTFVHQCVFYDLALERYTIDEMKKTTNLWNFFAKNTSKVRGIMYRDPSQRNSRSQFCSCKEAIERMRPLFEEEKNFYTQSEVFGRLPLNYQALTGLQQSASDLISQQLVISAMTEEITGNRPSFATSRAYTKQRETFQILGSLTAKSLVTMRNVLEALIYASFLFIAPLSFLPNGFRFLTTWCGLVVWLQLWPPFFSILNYIMQITAQSKMQAIFGSDPGLSFFTSVGLRDLYSDMHAVAGYLAASIPFITYAILKGGVGSFVHLASSMTAPSQSAATSTAEEKASGNYSFGNLSWGNLNAYNASAFKRHTAPVQSEGYFSEDTGKGGVTYASDGEIFYKQSKSDLRTSIQKSDSFSVALQEAQQDAQTLVDTETEQYNESLSNFASSSASFIEHLSQSTQQQQGVQEQLGSNEQQGIHNLGNLAEKFGERLGMDKRSSLELLTSSAISGRLGGSFKFLSGSADHSFRRNSGSATTNSKAYDEANEFVQSEQFQENWQQFLNFTKQANYQELSDEGARLSQDFQSSFQQVDSSQKSLQKAFTNMEQISETISLTKTDNVGVQQNLDHAFVKWASQREQSFDKAKTILDKEETDPEKVELIQAFVKSGALQSYNLRTNDMIQRDLQGTFSHTEMATPQQKSHQENLHKMQEAMEQKYHLKQGQSKDLYEQKAQESQDVLQTQSKRYHETKEQIQDKGRGVEGKAKEQLNAESQPGKQSLKDRLLLVTLPEMQDSRTRQVFNTLKKKDK